MKKPPHFNLIVITLLLSVYSLAAQQISVNGNVTVNQLIEDNLVDGCVEVSNITSSVNGDANGFRSFAEFSRASSNFPFESGIMLSTGNAESGGNNITTSDLSEGSTTWGTDPDLETALGNTNFLNATSIEFDFVSISNQVQFNYLLASEEYSGINPCLFSDGFAFLIREASSTGPYQNIAVVPGTSTPVSTNTVHDEIVGVCPAENEQYFDGYNIGDTNYNGRTEVLTATATITPYVQYHIKLVIADQSDRTFDSAVFIEGDSFRILDLGEDITTCASSVALNADIQNPSSSYEWFLNGSATPIPGATNATLNVTQSGTYKVEITTPLGSSSCIEEDEIVVAIQNEITLNSISDYSVCDDLSGDEVETFNLSTKDAELASIITFANYTFSYHLSDAEARSGANSITAPIQNTSLTQPIFVRIDDLDSGCVAYTSFNLAVYTIPNITSPTNLAICDDDNDPSDGFTTIDLSVKNDEITSGDTNLFVTYHYNALDADTGNNPIPIPYININTPTESLFVRVINTTTGCYTTSTLTVDITNSPIVDREPVPLDGCDSDYDGIDNFDLTEAISDILEGLTGVTTTFHESFNDANEGINSIANETNYQNITPEVQTVFVRVEDDITGCASIVPLEIHTNLLLTGTDTGEFALCDDGTNDGVEDFNLYVIETYIANELPGITVNFYETQNDLDNNTPLDKNQVYPASNPTNLIVSIGNGNCTEVSDINLVVNPILVFNPIAPIPYCDDDDDGVVSIDLSTFDDLVTSGNTDFTVSYFGSQTDAETNINLLPPFYTNTFPIETIYARIESIRSDCFTIESFEIEVRPAPAITQPSPWLICDVDDDGLTILNLEDKIPEIVASTTGLDIEFFATINDANNNTNPITNRTAFETATQTIFVRVEDNIGSGCYAIATLEIIVNTLPVLTPIRNFQLCEDDNDERTEFLFSDWDSEILNGQTEKDVFYFEDAAFTSPIDKTSLYTNTSSPQTIYVRVENITDTSCNATSSFMIEVGANPDYNAPEDELECDDQTNDGFADFDLNEKIDEISQGSTTNLDINFFTSEQNAIDNVDAVQLQFTNTINPQTIYVRIDNQDSDCFVIEDFGINVVAAPDLSEAEIFELCDDDYDGFAIFDLDNAQFENFDRVQSGTVVSYFENIDAVEDDALAIPNPNTYNSDSKTVYIKVTNTLTTCYTVLPLQLVVTPLPPIQFSGTYQICDNDTDTFDLSIMDNLIAEDLSTVAISYYSNLLDAQNNVNNVNIFNYSLNTHTIYTRMEDLVTGCIGYGNFTLQINQNPVANPPRNLEYCDDDYDGLLSINLLETSNDILGSQNENDYEITYYATLNDAEGATNPLAASHETNQSETIFVRLENKSSSCYDTTQFTTTVLPLPIIPVEDVVAFCTDNLPLTVSANTGISGDSYLWSNGATTPEITLNSINDIGDYWVTVTKATGCSFTKNFSVIESQQAPLNPSTTVNFADPNSITVNIDQTAKGDYRFILDDGAPQISNVFNNVSIGRHEITVIDLNGCNPAYDTLFIYDIPKFVTPNNDGFFDTWHITGVNELPGTQVFIYNRHGKLLKMLPHTSSGWDGTFNGQDMPADDYWFSADIVQDGEHFNIQGHFALKR